MRPSRLVLAFCLGCLASAAASGAAPTRMPALIPMPARVELGGGRVAVDPARLRAEGAEAERVAAFFSDLLRRSGQADAAPGAGATITFTLAPAADGPREGYRLHADAAGVRVEAATEAGLFYGAVTLWQLLDAEGRMPAVAIEDAPRFAWRGLMLDSARHLQSVEEIKSLLDAMALHKLNVFHWHLTDDQGWRIEIRRYPRLTEVGGCRIPAGDGGRDPATGTPRPYCGWYTQDQVREVVAYASARHITVVPEIEMPGHAQAAVAAYPALGSVAGPTAVSSDWGVHPYLFNVEEETLAFLENVLAEVIELFPGRYIHVGGDEAFKRQWENSPAVQARMRALGVEDETALQSWFMARIERFLVAHERRLIGWDEILEGGLPAEATVMSWRGTEGGIEAAEQGHDVVMAPSSELYLDYLQTDLPGEPPGRPSIIDLQQVYAFEPVPAALSAAEARHIVGVQANTWTEHLRSFDRVQHAMFPRAAALAEVAWSPKDERDFAAFRARLPAQLERYRALGLGYAHTPFSVRVEVDDRDADAARVRLSNPLGFEDIRYTLDGSAPDADSRRYTGAFDLAPPAELRAAVFDQGSPLAPPVARRIDAASRLRRDEEHLAMCSDSLTLRLEDDGPADGPRAIFNVDIFDPCWEWKDAPLAEARAVRVRAGRIPYYFQLAQDEGNRRVRPAATEHGELQLHAGCDGPELARIALPAGPAADGFATLETALPAGTGSGDLCLFFTGDTRPTIWVLDRVELVPGR
ncbi:family 20 glycosylhydrolase [Coralloluteibacterium stylophorae]|uniref:beta-N-acetylhexosaminidase n=1 Tax=Coralloluteibacterium stylophorae TaxID=1776034 RepID=A0A8J8AYW1_9GAMM|nr:family 20 glycosylhydrolase [Coralloluteibacterium stylophorae]MBS7456218.1 family 20 glycosylhydrolase [Coralloluteibacterium stylophorae]